MNFPDYIDDEDVRLWMKELILAGREISYLWKPGKRHSMEAVDDDPEALDHEAIIEIWNEGWAITRPGEEEDPWVARYRYEDKGGKIGWWRF